MIRREIAILSVADNSSFNQFEWIALNKDESTKRDLAAA
jgi:hypothetical protein